MGSCPSSRVMAGQLMDGTAGGSSCLTLRAPGKVCPPFILLLVKTKIHIFLIDSLQNVFVVCRGKKELSLVFGLCRRCCALVTPAVIFELLGPIYI